ncbi:hypothetical protein VOLCADRAFT_118312 [Volvox carteri f. nagariensis]|uniref:Glycosyltransferase 2-like domain-containing protein n=1 Tax=Volvox carteri f. nagariensis TaxID=3068 RepID=D8U3P8_VOLCA|nr:uncharacterized protein VOLCADRAFT_118312 [Volvox carteri f. nagariensis]EFJ45647.1 hypothetical protein VOLCADRAFT_118312 [Volvox carteri f. nagariensis]|eukprot:XP_002953337.1 hypothetical protein VOLCADRAFT_118312 [Volvox carteri f. nagariensis]
MRLGRPYPSFTSNPSEHTLEISTANLTSQLRTLLKIASIPARTGLSLEAAESLALTCLSTHLYPDLYTARPIVSVLLNYFKRPQVVTRIATNLRASCESVAVPCELVVNVDNPHEAAAWAGQAGFVIPVFSANLHEARGYNRAARLARGKYLIVWQDDQIPPTNGTWITQMIRIFETYPRLGILGMNAYRLCRQKERGNRWGPAGWDIDPRVGVPWTYAHFVDFAPMAVSARAFWELGGLDEGLSRRGDCGIVGDWELCARAWLSGWLVGHFSWEGRAGDGAGSTHSPVAAEACWNRQMDVGQRFFAKRYIEQAAFFQELCERVWTLNMLSFTLSQPEKCPYGNATYGWSNSEYANCTAPSLPDQRAALAARMYLDFITTTSGT